MRSVRINLMLSVSLLCSIVLLLTMDVFVAEDEVEDPSLPCILVRIIKEKYSVDLNS